MSTTTSPYRGRQIKYSGVPALWKTLGNADFNSVELAPLTPGFRELAMRRSNVIQLAVHPAARDSLKVRNRLLERRSLDAIRASAVINEHLGDFHGSGPQRGCPDHFFMQSLKLPVVAREHIRHLPSEHLAQGGLRDSGSLSDVLLGQATLDECGNEVACFHGGRIPSRLLCQSQQNMQRRLNEGMSREPSLLKDRFALARKKRGLTQVDVAKAAAMKQADISKIENGKIQQTTGIARLANALRVPVAWLELGDGPEPRWEAIGEPPAPPPAFADRIAVTPSEWALLQDVQLVLNEDEIQAIRRRAQQIDERYKMIKERAVKGPGGDQFLGGLDTNFGEMDDAPAQERKAGKK